MRKTLERERAKSMEIVPQPYRLKADEELITRLVESQGSIQAMCAIIVDAYEYGFIRGRRCERNRK